MYLRICWIINCLILLLCVLDERKTVVDSAICVTDCTAERDVTCFLNRVSQKLVSAVNG